MRMRTLGVVMFLIFLTGGVLGYISAKMNPSGVAGDIMSSFGNKVRTINFTPFSLRSVLLVFINNFTVALLMFLLGITVILPSIIVFLNGAVAGVVVAFAEEKGISLLLAVLAMIPHGIFELSAFFLSASYGTMLGIAFWRKIFGKGGDLFSLAVKMPFYIAFAAVLLITAAFIEVFISPLVFAV
ncbi:MAG: stage II sporulation protein M [Fervidicoccaceae archaeon]